MTSSLNKYLFRHAFYVSLMFIAATIIGYLLIYPGVIIHLSFGILHVCLFLFALVRYNDFPKSIKVQLLLYGLPCLYVLINLFVIQSIDAMELMIVSSIPLSFFFTAILFQLKKHYDEA